jgi:hypothetical protein
MGSKEEGANQLFSEMIKTTVASHRFRRLNPCWAELCRFSSHFSDKFMNTTPWGVMVFLLRVPIQRRHMRSWRRLRYGLGLLCATLDALSFCFHPCFLFLYLRGSPQAGLESVGTVKQRLRKGRITSIRLNEPEKNETKKLNITRFC